MGLTELFEYGAAHHGVVGLRCARATGVSSTTFLRFCRRYELAELQRNTFLLPGWRNDAAARSFAASLAAGKGAVITGWAALAQHGLTRSWPSTTELLVPASDHRQSLPRVRTRWSAALPPDAVIEVGAVPFTDVARTLAHLADRTTLHRLRATAFDAMANGLLDTSQLQRELDARGRFHGRGTIRQLLEDLTSDGSESGFEFDTRDRLTAEGLRPDDQQPVLPTRTRRHRRMDIAYRDRLVAIDCVSFLHHSAHEDLEADVIRSNEIAELDRWLILQLTFRMFHQNWETFVAQLRRCLAQRAPAARPALHA